MLLRASSVILRRFAPAVARTGTVGGLALQRPLLSRLQVASVVSISRFEMEHDPRASTRVRFHLPEEPTADQKIQYISFYFWEDGEPADVAWTFTIPDEGKDILEVLTNYALRMGDDADDEYVRAYQGFVAGLYASSRITKDSAGSDMDVKIPKERTRRKPKAPTPASLLPGRARNEEIELRLRQGQSFLDVASSLERTPEFIVRESKRLLGDELAKLMSRKKRGKWSEDEIQRLISLRNQGLSPPELTMWLRRTKLSVEKQLRALGNTIFEPTAVEGPQEIPPDLQMSLFTTRLNEIWQGLLKSEMTDAWRDALRVKSAEEWLSAISAGIPEDVKKVLGGLRTPTWEELESLSLIDTHDAGVYARLVKTPYEFQTASDRYLYVGSASRYGGGLNLRIAEHKMKTRRSHESRLQRDIRTKKLKGGDRFVTLMVMKMDDPRKEAVLDLRRTVVLAEAILTVWLSALQLQSPAYDLKHLCPWDRQTVEYSGWSSHNPLVVDVLEPNEVVGQTSNGTVDI